MNKIIFSLNIVFACFIAHSQGGINCSGMAPICTDVGLNFTANADGDQASTVDPGNNYDCLIGQPNPTWYYFQIATDGDIQMELAAAQDIDYVIWGPFTSLSVAQAACGSLGNQAPPNPNNGNLVDCSFSTASVENPVITAAITGEVYVMLITNYAGVVQNITLSQTGGTGSTDCSIVTDPPCAISSFVANVSGCDFATNNYQISGSVSFTDPPTAGDLVFEDCYGNTTVLASAPFTSNTVNYTIANLLANGDACSSQVYFTDQVSCGQTVNYVAPVCVNNCPTYELQASSPAEACGNQQYFLEVQNSGCDGIVNFEVIGDYGSFASEISWSVTSNLSGNVVASGTGGVGGGPIAVSVGPLDPNTEGSVFNLVVEDSWGDGFSGGGYIQVESMDGSTVFAGPIQDNFGAMANQYFNAGIIVSSSTISVTTPNGTITSNVGNCADHSVPVTLENNNYCTPTVVDLPWSITCDLTGDLIASGTHTVTVYPQVPTSASDLVSIDWNSTTCSWDVTPQNDCSALDLNVLYSISPDPSTFGTACADGTEEFTVTYLGFENGPDCCSTGGPLTPATYSNSQGTSDFITQTAYGGTNNAAYGTIPASGIGGNSTSVTIDVSGSGYCFPNVPVDPLAFPVDPNPDSYYVDIYVDGVQIALYGPLNDPPGSFNYSFNHADLLAAGVTYNQNSVVEVYVLPNQFFYTGPPVVNTTYVPGANCNNLAAGQWSASDFSININAIYQQLVPSPANCSFIVNEPYTCCTLNPITATAPANENVQCISDLPVSDITSVTNIVSDCPVVVAFVSDVSDGNTCPETITRTYSVSDDCGNSINVTQTITVNDITPPTASNPAGITVECISDVPAADVSVLTDAADNCTVSPVVSFVEDVSDGNTCPETITRTYSVTDDCGNSINVTQTITVNDITPPTASNPTGLTVECVGDVPVADISVVTDAADNCTALPVVAFVSDASDGNTCPEIITRTYSVTDDCGNVTVVSQTITINDITPPTASNPAGLTVECIGDIPAADISVVADAADNCTAIPTVSFVSDVSDGNTCPETITRTYFVTDDCGNSTNVTQTITVNDITPPTASNPPNINIPLAPAPAPDITVITDAADNCTAAPIVAFVSDQSDGGECPEVITRIYSVTDDCGNETLVTQLIVIGGGLVPAPTVTANGPICEGEDAVFTIDGLVDAVVTYDVGAGLQTLTLLGGTGDVTVPSVNSNVTITISNIADGSCSSIIDLSATTVVNILSLPTFTSFGPYCQNETPDALPAVSIEGYTGTWNPPSIDASVSGIGVYTFIPDAGQCASETFIEVEIIEPIVPLFTQIDDICEGTEVFPGGSPFPVTSTGGIIGVWAPVFDAFNTTTYTFTPDPAFCATTTTMTITIVGFPVVDAGLDQIITCTNNVDGAQLGSAEVPGNVYSWSPITGLSDPNIANPIANPSVSTTYTLTVTNSTGCSAEGTVNVSVDDTPPVVAITNNTGSTTLTCTQLEISVTATGADTYTWDNGLGNVATPIITSPGIYTVTGMAANGCQSSAQIEVIQDNGVDLLLVLAQPEICSGDVVDISMNSSNATDFNWTVIQSGATGATNGTASNAGFGASISQVLTVTGAGNGTVDYAVEPILGGCVGTAQIVTVTVLDPETPQFNQLGPFCINDAASALPTNSLEGIAGTWSPSSISTNTVGTSIYSFTPNSGQCAGSQTMEIIVNELPVVSFSGDSLVGCAPHTVALTSLNDNCTWTISNGVVIEGSQATLVLTNPGCYDVTLEVDEGGCSNSLTMPSYICIEQNPVADFTASPDLFTDDDALVSFTNLSSGASSFIWDFGDGNTSNYINPSNLYENTEEGALITLTAISDFGCTDQTQLIIEYDEQEVFYIPNTFTPDGDNFNQMFTPVFYSGFDPYNFEMLIFNRWGEIVFETHNSEIGWDGTYGVKGTKATDGTYSWKITYKNPKTDERKVIVGHVTLMR